MGMGAKGSKVNPKELLGKIDHDAPKADDMIEALFNKFDVDKSGKLEGAELTALVDEIAKYVLKELSDKDPSLMEGVVNDELLREMITGWMDTGGDGKCDKQ